MKAKKWLLVGVLVAALAGGAYYGWRAWQAPVDEASATTETLRTAVARRGNLVLMTTAAGTVVPSREEALGFEASAELLELYVSVGDRVSKGQPLARIDDTLLRQEVTRAEIQRDQAMQALAEARKAYEDLQDGPDSLEILEAEAALKSAEEALEILKAKPTAAEIAAAEAALAEAQEAYQRLLSGPTEEELREAQWNLERAKNNLWAAQMSRDARGNERDKASGAYDQAQVSVLNAEIAVREAEMTLQKLQEPPTEAELAAAKANVLKAQEALEQLRRGPTAAEIASAELAVAQAKERLEELKSQPTEEDLRLAEIQCKAAEADLAQAEYELQQARDRLAATTLVAPFAGIVTAINAQVGDTVGANVITLADLDQPLLEVYVDETEIDQIQVGFEAQVTLDAWPDLVLPGQVIAVDPVLTSESGMRVVRGVVALKPEALASARRLMSGMSATVDIIGGRAENAVLVPIEALREVDEGQYAVFVVENGTPRLRFVKVGLMDAAYAEIVSGLEAGEIVSTGLVEVK